MMIKPNNVKFIKTYNKLSLYSLKFFINLLKFKLLKFIILFVIY